MVVQNLGHVWTRIYPVRLESTKHIVLVISGSIDKTIRLRNAESGSSIRMDGHDDAVTSVCFSSDDMWITSGCMDKTINIWNVSKGELFFKGFTLSRATSVTVFPPSFVREYIKLALASIDGLAYIWCVNTYSDEQTWGGSFNGEWLTKNDGNLVIWIPPDTRRTLVNYLCTQILNCQSSIVLTMSRYQGNQWATCFSSSI